MSRGIGGWAYLIFEDEETVKYQYGSFDWNDPNHFNDDKICDGEILIHKILLSNPPYRNNLSVFLNDRIIEVINCGNCWAKTSDFLEVEFIALSLISGIFDEYDKKYQYPMKKSICK
ncbi:MAG: hypothetical protein Q4F95_09275 [Oscillospiraceae bacterium]|nr:hypothetical protein [Oscillospiraceae bacterium]